MSKLPLWIFTNLHEIIRDLEKNYILDYTNNSAQETDMERIINKLNNAKDELFEFEEKYGQVKE